MGTSHECRKKIRVFLADFSKTGDQILPYSSLGCFRDNGNRAIPTLERRDSLLDGAYTSRKDAVNKCYRAALGRGYKVFAVQNGGWCASSPRAEQTYDKYGRSTACRGDGEGGPWANRVYEIGGQCHTLWGMRNLTSLFLRCSSLEVFSSLVCSVVFFGLCICWRFCFFDSRLCVYYDCVPYTSKFRLVDSYSRRGAPLPLEPRGIRCLGGNFIW